MCPGRSTRAGLYDRRRPLVSECALGRMETDSKRGLRQIPWRVSFLVVFTGGNTKELKQHRGNFPPKLLRVNKCTRIYLSFFLMKGTFRNLNESMEFATNRAKWLFIATWANFIFFSNSLANMPVHSYGRPYP